MWRYRANAVAAIVFAVNFSACGSGLKQVGSQAPKTSTESSSSSSVDSFNANTDVANTGSERTTSRRRAVAPVEVAAEPNVVTLQSRSAIEQLDVMRAALKPLQVLLGRWNGTSQKARMDHPDWAYDWVTNPKQPALRIRSNQGTYIREGRLAYLPDSEQFEFTTTDAEGTSRRFQGTFIEPVRDVARDEKKLQRTYKLQLTEPIANATGEQWRVTFNQQENHRYIFEVDRKRGNGPFSRVDTIHTQREGTSFAISDTDYGDKTCIISQGLGTISVSYQGQTFWVCCTGCQAALNEEPAKWIGKWEEKKKSTGKSVDSLRR